MKLLIMQHGEAVSGDVDPDRPLTSRGRHDVEQAGRLLASTGLEVEQVCHSGKNRARESADILARSLGVAADSIAIEGIGPRDSPLAFTDRMVALADATAIVSHMPFVARVVSIMLTGNEEPQLVAFEPGTIACLEHDEHGGWQLSWLLRPGITL